MNLLNNIYNLFTSKKSNSYSKTDTSNYALNRMKYTIKDWKDSLKFAEDTMMPSRSLMQEIYNECLTDSTILSAISKRKNLNLQKKTLLKNEKGEDVTSKYKQYFTTQLYSHVLDSLAMGYTLLNMSKITEKGIEYDLYRRAYLDVENNTILYNTTSYTGKSFMNNDFLLYSKTENYDGNSKVGLGYLYPVSLYFILLRENLNQNLVYNQKYNTPMVVSKTFKSEGSMERESLFNSLKNLQTASVLLCDPDDSLEFIESKNVADAYSSFSNFEDRIKKEIFRLILNHSSAMDAVSGALGSQDNIQEALEEKQKSDYEYLHNFINNTFIPQLTNLGVFQEKIVWEFDNDDELVESKNENIDYLQKTANMLKTLTEANIELNEEIIAEFLNLKKNDIDIINNTNITNKIKNLYKNA